jgi:hypothetical protein
VPFKIFEEVSEQRELLLIYIYVYKTQGLRAEAYSALGHALYCNCNEAARSPTDEEVSSRKVHENNIVLRVTSLFDNIYCVELCRIA